jgi:hypothetical protein
VGDTATFTITVNPSMPHSLNISASSSAVCSGETVTFTANAVGSVSPNYQWKKNGVNISGATNSTYTYMPLHGDIISCEVTSNTACATPAPTISSNNITMTVTAKVYPAVTVTATPN